MAMLLVMELAKAMMQMLLEMILVMMIMVIMILMMMILMMMVGIATNSTIR